MALPFQRPPAVLFLKMVQPKTVKLRLDELLVSRGLADSLALAQAMILAGEVLVDGQKIVKSGDRVDEQASLRLLGKPLPFVSRAGIKLNHALEHFHVEVAGRICLDIGASTGGFTDCLLQRGAARVIAVDAGTNQLDWKLRCDPRVVSMEKTNARYLNLVKLGTPVSLVTADVSFISVTMILPVLPELLEPQAEALVLVKPQFEVRREQVGTGGLVSDPQLHRQALTRVSRSLLDLGFVQLDSVPSVLPGATGNREYFLHAVWQKRV